MKSKNFCGKIIALIAVIALVSVLGICLVACNNEKDFEKRLGDKDYIVVSMTGELIEEYAGDSVGEVEWAVMGMKGNANSSEYEFVCVIKCASKSDAEDCENEMTADMPNGMSFVRKGKIVIFGTEQAVKDAQ